MAVMDRNGMAHPQSDDLPRTLRREREARERAAQPLFSAAPPQPPGSAFLPDPIAAETSLLVSGTTVTDVRIPFVRMMLFCFKLVFAAIPALILLGCLLWLAGHLLLTFAPWLLKIELLIRVPR